MMRCFQRVSGDEVLQTLRVKLCLHVRKQLANAWHGAAMRREERKPKNYTSYKNTWYVAVEGLTPSEANKARPGIERVRA